MIGFLFPVLLGCLGARVAWRRLHVPIGTRVVLSLFSGVITCVAVFYTLLFVAFEFDLVDPVGELDFSGFGFFGWN